MLNDFSPEIRAEAIISAANFAMWMERYVLSHTRSTVVNGSVAEGKNGTVPWVGENLQPLRRLLAQRILRVPWEHRHKQRPKLNRGVTALFFGRRLQGHGRHRRHTAHPTDATTFF